MPLRQAYSHVQLTSMKSPAAVIWQWPSWCNGQIRHAGVMWDYGRVTVNIEPNADLPPSLVSGDFCAT